MPSFKDISTYFNITSNCCIQGQSSKQIADLEETRDLAPRRNSAQISEELKEYIKGRTRGTQNFVHVTTITIGRKWLGKLSSKEQYKIMKRDIKRHIRFHDKHKKYLYCFEHQENGQLHAHGVEIGTMQGGFIESFSHYGQRNCHPKAFQPARNIEKYIEYIGKEHAFPFITNIHKKEIKEEAEASPPTSLPQGGGEEDTSSERRSRDATTEASEHMIAFE